MLSALSILLLLLLLAQADVRSSLFQACEAAEAGAPTHLQLPCRPSAFTCLFRQNKTKTNKTVAIFS